MELWRTKQTVRYSTVRYGYQTAIMLFLKTFSLVSCTASHDRLEKCHILAPHPLDISSEFENENMFRLWISGFWQCVVLYMNAIISEEHTAAPWRVKIQVWHWSDTIQVWNWSEWIQVWQWSDRIPVLLWSDRNQVWYLSDKIKVWHWSDRVQAINGSGS